MCDNFNVTPEQAALVERRILPLLKDAAYGARPLRHVIANAYIIGMADAAQSGEGERARVVAWLRNEGGNYLDAANAIERGEHLGPSETATEGE